MNITAPPQVLILHQLEREGDGRKVSTRNQRVRGDGVRSRHVTNDCEVMVVRSRHVTNAWEVMVVRSRHVTNACEVMVVRSRHVTNACMRGYITIWSQ